MNSWLSKKISSEEYQEWFDNYRLRLVGRSPFHHPVWLETVARALKFRTAYIGSYEKGALISVIPSFLFQRGPIRLLGSPLRGTMTSYLGPISLKPFGSEQERMDLLALCSSFARREWGVAYSRFTLRDMPENRPELAANWQAKRSGSYRLDLTKGVDELWKGLKSDCRRNIRRAREAGMEVVPFKDASLFYRMIEATFRRHRSTSWHKESFFSALFSGLAPPDLMWVWGVRYQGEIIAGALFLHDDQEIHFISGASLPEFGSLPTSYLLHWNAIETGANLGLRIFNSERSRIRSIDQFKESFRPTLEKRYTLSWAPSYVHSAQKVVIRASSYIRRASALLKRVNKNPIHSN